MRSSLPGAKGVLPGPPLALFMGHGRAMRDLMETLRAVASTDVAVLIQGESGTGKELCAQWLHSFAKNRAELMVKVSCPAIPQALLESELFGYEKGAFTGAHAMRRGRVEQADGGTLLLDEIGSLHISMQVKLLRFLQDGTFSRVGGHDLHQIRTRLVSTANRDLKEQVAEGTFRLDLLYRINAISLTMPALRDRTEDIPDLVEYFLEHHSSAFGTKPAPIPRDILQGFGRYAWPGNIRQLENMVRSYALIGNVDVLIPEESEYDPGMEEIDVSVPASLKTITKQATAQLERHIILKVLKANGWNRRATAKWLKISYRSLLYKLSAFGQAEPHRVVPMVPKAAQPHEQASRLLRQDH